MLTKNIKIIKQTLSKKGTFQIIDKDRRLFKIIYKNKSFYILKTFVIKHNVCFTTGFTRYKDVTKIILHKSGIKVPKGISVNTKESDQSILKRANKLKFPLIVKNAYGSGGHSVIENIYTKKDLLNVIKRKKKTKKSFLIEQMENGKEYRVLMLGDRAIAIYERIKPHVIGNGKDSIAALINKRQENIEEKIKINKKLKKYIKEQGFASLKKIPKKNIKVYYKRIFRSEQGSIRIDRTDEIHKSIEKICAKANKAIGLSLSGIDLSCKDISKNIKDQNYSILEINAKPDLYMHYEPDIGKPRDVVKDILDFIVKQ